MSRILVFGLGILTGMVIMLFITGIIHTIVKDHIDKK